MIRFFDVVISLIGLIVLIPCIIIISIVIKISSLGPIIYTQKRVGRFGRDFTLYKFRSMQIDADKKSSLTVGNRDPRITFFGYYIRKYKLDEIPQLYNVLKGDMSIVGPRPELRKYVDLYTDHERIILNIRPGITDLASLKYIHENEILFLSDDPEYLYINTIAPEKIKLNMFYLNNYNLFNYFKILILTIYQIIRLDNENN